MLILLQPQSASAQQMAQLPVAERAAGLYQGALSYRDYTSDEWVSLPLVAAGYAKGNRLQLECMLHEWGRHMEQHYRYTFKNGTLYHEGAWNLRGQDVSDTDYRYVFEREGKDGNERRPCTFRLTFAYTGESFSISKEVRWEGESEFFLRNRYTLQRLESSTPAH